jgi:hypothetical protein
MPKHKKTPVKKSIVASFLQSSGVTVVAIVLLFVSLGAVMVPGILADTARPITPFTSNVTATAANSASYAVNLAWDGYSANGYLLQAYRGSSLVKTWTSSTKTSSASGLVCGNAHTFKVAARATDGSAASSYASATATPPCPTASWLGLSGGSGVLYASWKDVYGFSQTYTVVATSNYGYTNTITTSSTSTNIPSSCGQTFSVTIKASAGGQSGPTSASKSASTLACPAPSGGGGSSGSGSTGGTTTPPPGTTSGGTTSGGTTSNTGTTSGGTKSATTKSTVTKKSTTAAPAPTPAPSTPENFSADVISRKVVALTWDKSSNAAHYILKRSTDQTTWQEIAAPTETTYNDESGAFSTTYYYQLQAVGSDGQVSGAVTAQATTQSFEGSSNTITSSDKLVTVTVPDGAIDGDYNCSLTTSEDGLDPSALSANQSALLGPFDLLCVLADGVVVEKYEQPLKVVMNLSSVAAGYDDITVRLSGSDKWTTTDSTYDANKRTLTFELTSSRLFAAFGVKHKSPVGTVITVIVVLLLIGAAVAAGLWWRRRAPMQMAAIQSQISAEEEFKEALAKPNCSHLSMAQQVMPSSQGCLECEAQHTQWTALRICLLCGHVGCSDDSPQQHALKHYQQTGHPLIYDYADPNGNSIGWCYIDQTYI